MTVLYSCRQMINTTFRGQKGIVRQELGNQVIYCNETNSYSEEALRVCINVDQVSSSIMPAFLRAREISKLIPQPSERE